MSPSLPLKRRDVQDWLASELPHMEPGGELVSPFWPSHLYSPGLQWLSGREGVWAEAWGGCPMAELRQLKVVNRKPGRWQHSGNVGELPGRRPFLDFPHRVMEIKLSDATPDRQQLFGFIRDGEIDPERFGELRVYEKTCELAAEQSVVDRVVDSLRRRGVEVELQGGYSRSLKPEEVRTESCAGNRLDAVVGQFFRVSRSEASTAIEQQFVTLNWQLAKKTSRALSTGDLVSFRMKGRIRLLGMEENPRSGRQMIEAEVFSL